MLVLTRNLTLNKHFGRNVYKLASDIIETDNRAENFSLN